MANILNMRTWWIVLVQFIKLGTWKESFSLSHLHVQRVSLGPVTPVKMHEKSNQGFMHGLSDTNYSIYMMTRTYIMCSDFPYYISQMIKKYFLRHSWSSSDTKAAQQSNYWTWPTLVSDNWCCDHRRRGRQRRQV